MIPGLLASSFTIKNSVVVNLSGSCLLFHSHSSWDGSSLSLPCIIKLLFSSKELLVSFFLSWTLIRSTKTLIEKPPDFLTKSSAPSFNPNNSSISSSLDVKKLQEEMFFF